MTPPRPRFGGLPLGQSGAAFELARPAQENTRVRVGSWVVSTERGSAIVVARGRVRSHAAAVRHGIARSEQALDKLTARGIDDLALAGADNEHLAWWKTTEGVTLRVVSTSMHTLSVPRMTVEVRDPSGRLVRPARPSPVPWHPSFRYYRLSQLTDDLSDAFRNAYLALESILAERTPHLPRRRGQPAETEADWFRRALISSGVNLSEFVPRRQGREAAVIYDRLYLNARIRLFHAKPNRDPLLPRDRRSVGAVSDALELAQRLYLAAVQAHLGVERGRGGFTSYAAAAMARAVLEPIRFVATSDESEFDAAATTVSSSAQPVVELPTSEPGVYQGFSASRRGWASGDQLRGLPYVRRIVGVAANGRPMVQCRLEARLWHAGLARLEMEFRIRMRNRGAVPSGLV